MLHKYLFSFSISEYEFLLLMKVLDYVIFWVPSSSNILRL